MAHTPYTDTDSGLYGAEPSNASTQVGQPGHSAAHLEVVIRRCGGTSRCLVRNRQEGSTNLSSTMS
jgi:hypothetical protein